MTSIFALCSRLMTCSGRHTTVKPTGNSVHFDSLDCSRARKETSTSLSTDRSVSDCQKWPKTSTLRSWVCEEDLPRPFRALKQWVWTNSLRNSWVPLPTSTCDSSLAKSQSIRLFESLVTFESYNKLQDFYWIHVLRSTTIFGSVWHIMRIWKPLLLEGSCGCRFWHIGLWPLILPELSSSVSYKSCVCSLVAQYTVTASGNNDSFRHC